MAVDHFNNCPILVQDEVPERNHVDVISDLSCSSETHEASHPYSNCPPSKQHHYVSIEHMEKLKLLEVVT